MQEVNEQMFYGYQQMQKSEQGASPGENKTDADSSGGAVRARAADGDDAYSTFNPFGGAYRGVAIGAETPVTAEETMKEATKAAMEEAAAARGDAGEGASGAAGGGGAVKFKKKKRKKKNMRSKD